MGKSVQWLWIATSSYGIVSRGQVHLNNAVNDAISMVSTSTKFWLFKMEMNQFCLFSPCFPVSSRRRQTLESLSRAAVPQ